MVVSDIEMEKRGLLKEIIESSLRLVRRKINLKEMQQNHLQAGESRSLELIIEGMEDINTGYVLENGELRVFKKLHDTPTVKVMMSQDTFLDLCSGEKTLTEAYLGGLLSVYGEYWLRDMVLWQEYLFDKDGGIFG